MKENLVNLNVNPCKMCMPMGAVTTFYGIKNCMTILHGSQGCSTYIRRHMATHYNEPVDIASSSLTEEGTVYGGEKNLLKGLLNLINIYHPEVIGVATTCLAETIGEDVGSIIRNFYERYPEHRTITIIPVSTAGYGGTQFEGYIEAVYQIVRSVPMNITPNNRVNVITSQLSPADTRYLKELLNEFGVNYILLPDLSDNLDGVYQEHYNRLPGSGTDIKDIIQMAGAKATIEISSFSGHTKSVAEYLKDTYGVPYYQCNLPISLRDNDELLRILQEISGRVVSQKQKQMRGRYLDAMIDGHKYNGEARAVIYGEPDFVYSTVRLCVENGVMPVVIATGSKNEDFRKRILEEIKDLAERYYIEQYEILDDVDFQTIEHYAKELKANLLIGNSDGRRIAKKLGVKLVRRSFPVHDRVGGQRLRSIGYEGALSFLDEISNAILEVKEDGFREQLYQLYYKDEKSSEKIPDISEETGTGDNNLMIKPPKIKSPGIEATGLVSTELENVRNKMIEEKTKTHPCFTCHAHKYSRMHLPIAPKCNISCNYCLRKYDCPNESRPGVTTRVLNPEEALQRFLAVKAKVDNLSVVGIAGPGDALANFEETKRSLELIRQQDPEITFCLSTNGLMLPQYVQELVELGVTHVTVTLNAVDPSIGAFIYKHIDYMGARYDKEEAAAILLANQLAGIRMLTAKGIICKVNIVMIKGVNDLHIPAVVRKAKELGAAVTNIMPMIPVQGSAFEHLAPVEEQELLIMRQNCGQIMKQMYHCRHCRADAIGMLGDDISKEFELQSANILPVVEGKAETILQVSEFQSEKELKVAVATKSGILVDQHFGHVTEFYVYEYSNGNVEFMEKRSVDKYCIGPQECDDQEDKIDSIIRTISDCNAVIAMRIGEVPKKILNFKGIRTFMTMERIEDSVQKVVSQLL